MIDGVRPMALTAERIFERVCLRLVLEAKSSLVMTIHNGLSSFKQSSKWAFAKSIPAPALPSISWAEDVPPAALGAFSPSSAAMQRTAPGCKRVSSCSRINFFPENSNNNSEKERSNLNWEKDLSPSLTMRSPTHKPANRSSTIPGMSC